MCSSRTLRHGSSGFSHRPSKYQTSFVPFTIVWTNGHGGVFRAVDRRLPNGTPARRPPPIQGCLTQTSSKVKGPRVQIWWWAPPTLCSFQYFASLVASEFVVAGTPCNVLFIKQELAQESIFLKIDLECKQFSFHLEIMGISCIWNEADVILAIVFFLFQSDMRVLRRESATAAATQMWAQCLSPLATPIIIFPENI